jgi:hypothetical protein
VVHGDGVAAGEKVGGDLEATNANEASKPSDDSVVANARRAEVDPSAAVARVVEIFGRLPRAKEEWKAPESEVLVSVENADGAEGWLARNG